MVLKNDLEPHSYPLTVTDNFSRYVLAIEGSEKISGEKVKNTLTHLFLEPQ